MSTTKFGDSIRGTTLPPGFLYSAAPRQPKKSELALQYLEELLRDYPVGEKLPSEREIAERLNMTRSPVREALIAMQMARKIRIEPGIGAFFLGGESGTSSTSAISFLAENESPFEIRQLRQILEAAIVRSAIAELTPDSLHDIESAFDRMEAASKDKDRNAFIEAHRGFHFALALASGNSLFERLAHWILYHVMTQPVWEMIMYRRLRETDKRVSDSIVEHRQILDAIRTRDAERASLLMRDHFARVL